MVCGYFVMMEVKCKLQRPTRAAAPWGEREIPMPCAQWLAVMDVESRDSAPRLPRGRPIPFLASRAAAAWTGRKNFSTINQCEGLLQHH